MRNVFGWDLPPGCTDADIDRAFGDPEGEECECCEGTGRVAEPVRRKYWTLWEKVKVFFGGEAPTEDTACPHCDGEGWVADTRDEWDRRHDRECDYADRYNDARNCQ